MKSNTIKITVVSVLIFLAITMFWYYVGDSNSGTAVATALLAAITTAYVMLTDSILNEQVIERKTKLIEKKLEKFYIPLLDLISKYETNPPSKEMAKIEIREAGFMRHRYLHPKDKYNILFILKRFYDSRSTPDVSDLIGLKEYVENEIDDLIEEYYNNQEIKQPKF